MFDNEFKIIRSSRCGAKIGSSVDRVQIESSGNGAQIGCSGDRAKIGSSGDRAQIGCSGDKQQIDILGNNSVCFACGYKSIIKAKKGTWVSLCEYKWDKETKSYIPIYAKSAQIGNQAYRDYSGKILSPKVYYILWKKEFYPVKKYDEIWSIILSEKKRDNINIIKTVDIEDIYTGDIKEIYIATEGKFSAHGYTIREAVEDLILKKLDNNNVDEIVSKIKETGKVTRSQYRAITGACSYGTNKFCEEHNIQDLEEIELDELRKILDPVNDYGAEKFWNLVDRKSQ